MSADDRSGALSSETWITDSSSPRPNNDWPFPEFLCDLAFSAADLQNSHSHFLGGVFVFFVLVLKNSDVNMGNYGDITRELTNTIHSDALLALIEMMDVGWGKFYVMGGMLSGLVAASLLKTRTDNAA